MHIRPSNNFPSDHVEASYTSQNNDTISVVSGSTNPSDLNISGQNDSAAQSISKEKSTKSSLDRSVPVQ